MPEDRSVARFNPDRARPATAHRTVGYPGTARRLARHCFRILLSLALLGAGQALLEPEPGEAQSVRGSVVDGEMGQPVTGAVLRLLDEDGEERARAMSRGDGTFALEGPEEGRYRLEGERMGYLSALGDPFRLERGDVVHQEIELSPNPVDLAGIEVEGDQRCQVRPEDGEAAARLWEEARMALTATEVTEEEDLHRFEVVRWRRELDSSATRVEEESREARRYLSANPLRSAPAEELEADGYIQPQPDGSHVYYAPDAETLLSDAFLDTHCFTVEEGAGDEEGLLGLSFQPVEDRGVPGVKGVLWIDPTSSQLRHMEADYTNYPYDVATGELGARVEFQRLPTGAWFVDRWWIRMPRVGLERSDFRGQRIERLRLLGISEVGGEARLAQEEEGDAAGR